MTTAIERLDRFWIAEDYHQKYVLQASAAGRELHVLYPRMKDFTDSTAAARLNAWLAGHGDRKLFEAEIGEVGLSKEAQAVVRARMGRPENNTCGKGD